MLLGIAWLGWMGWIVLAYFDLAWFPFEPWIAAAATVGVLTLGGALYRAWKD